MLQELLQPVELGKPSAIWGILRLPINLQWNAEPVWRWLNNHLTDPPKIKPWVLDLGQLDSSHDPMIQWHPNFLNLLGSKNWIGSTKLSLFKQDPHKSHTAKKVKVMEVWQILCPFQNPLWPIYLHLGCFRVNVGISICHTLSIWERVMFRFSLHVGFGGSNPS